MNSKPNFPSEMHWSTQSIKCCVPVFIICSPIFKSVAGYPENEANRTTARPFIFSSSDILRVSLKFIFWLFQNVLMSIIYLLLLVGKTLHELKLIIVIVFGNFAHSLARFSTLRNLYKYCSPPSCKGITRRDSFDGKLIRPWPVIVMNWTFHWVLLLRRR